MPNLPPQVINGTNSLVNLVQGSSAQPEPLLNMGATRLMFTDRVPCTVVQILRYSPPGTAIEIRVREDRYKRLDKNGLSESQEYQYSYNPDGMLHTYTRRKNGAWVRKGDSLKHGERLALGIRERYWDPHF